MKCNIQYTGKAPVKNKYGKNPSKIQIIQSILPYCYRLFLECTFWKSKTPVTPFVDFFSESVHNY